MDSRASRWLALLVFLAVMGLTGLAGRNDPDGIAWPQDARANHAPAGAQKQELPALKTGGAEGGLLSRRGAAVQPTRSAAAAGNS